jgi:hypothetical protein
MERNGSLHLLIDSTGLKIYGEAEWLEEERGRRCRRHWRKLHLAVDANSHEIVPDLLDQIDGSIASVTGDGAYDADEVYDEVERRHPEADVIIPSRSTAVVSKSDRSWRNAYLRTI